MAAKIEEPQMAAKEPVGVIGDEEHLKEMRDAADEALERRVAKDEKVAQRLERRQADKDGKEAVAATADVREQETARRKEQEKAFDEAQERVNQWIAPEPVKGRMTDVKLVLTPEPKVRKMSIHVRVLGEVADGYVMVLEDPIDKKDLKKGRVAESPRFGTKNRVRAEGVDDKGMAKGEVTHPGYFDFGPLRMNPGKFRAVVVDTDDDVLAEEGFEIVPDWDEDGQSDQVKGVHAGTPKAGPAKRKGAVKSVSQSETERAAKGEQQVARQAAKAAGTKVPPAPGDGA